MTEVIEFENMTAEAGGTQQPVSRFAHRCAHAHISKNSVFLGALSLSLTMNQSLCGGGPLALRFTP